MKLVLLLIAALSLCAGNAVPSIPGDNSNYKEGDRYVWIPDGNGVPRLADLQATEDEATLRHISRNAAAGTRYFFYSRRNPTDPKEWFYGDNGSVLNSGLQLNKPLNVIIHGLNGDRNSTLNTLITNALLQFDDTNVLVMDWGHLANGLYLTAISNMNAVGVGLAEFLKYINLLGMPYSNIHISSFSLGPHIAGIAGRNLGQQIGRITGLEPAGPGVSSNTALRSTDAQYVETMHTASDSLGMWEPIGHASFYPNGGSSQPGCFLSTCSHSRAWEFFASSIITNHLWARQCNNLSQAQVGSCTGPTFPMGNGIVTKRGNGIYFLPTTNSWPF